MEVKALHLVRLSPIWLLISSPPTTTGFDFTDYGYDRCEISLQKAYCSTKSGGSRGPVNIQNCRGIPDDEQAPLDNGHMFTVVCCKGDGLLDISCLARQKQVSCQRGYSWSRPNGEYDDNGYPQYDKLKLTTQGSLTVFFNEYLGLEYMLHQSKKISSGSSIYTGYEMYCNGTVRKVTRPKPSDTDTFGIALGCGLGVLFVVVAIMVTLLLNFRRKMIARDGFILRITEERAQSSETEQTSIPTETDELTVDLNHSTSRRLPNHHDDILNNSDIQAWRAGTPISTTQNTDSTPSVLNDPLVVSWRSRSVVPSAESSQEHFVSTEIAASTDTELISTRTERNQHTVDLNHSWSNIEPTELEANTDIQAWRAGIPFITNSTPSVLDDPSTVSWRSRSRSRSAAASPESSQEQQVPQRHISETLPSYESLLRPPPGYSEVIND